MTEHESTALEEGRVESTRLWAPRRRRHCIAIDASTLSEAMPIGATPPSTSGIDCVPSLEQAAVTFGAHLPPLHDSPAAESTLLAQAVLQVVSPKM